MSEGGQQRLERAPGERYRGGPPPVGDAGGTDGQRDAPRRRRRTAPWLAALGGALLVAVAATFDVGIGLLVIALFVGWLIGLALVWGGTPASGRRGSRGAWGIALAAGSIVLGFAIVWAWSHLEGGVMDPFAYLWARFGLLAPLSIVLGSGAAWLRAR